MVYMVHWGPSQKNSGWPKEVFESESCLSDQPGLVRVLLHFLLWPEFSHHDLYFSRLAYEVLLLIVWECTSAYFSKVIVFGCRVPNCMVLQGIHRTPQATAFTAVVSYEVKDTTAKSKRKDPRESPGQTRDELWCRLPGEPHRMNFIPETFMTATPWALSTRVVHWTQSIGVMRAGHVGTLCLGPTKPQTPWRETCFNINSLIIETV